MPDRLGTKQLIRLAAAWILENNPGARVAQVDITGATPLLQTGLVDSLGLVDLMAFLETTTGHTIDLLEINEDETITLERLCRAISDEGQITDGALE